MATRGCTSSAASSDPHVCRVSWTRMWRMPAFWRFGQSKLRVKLRGSIGVPSGW